MRAQLIRHPKSSGGAIAAIAVDAARDANGGLRLCYKATGDLGRVILPERVHGARADELWRTTCFEAFVRTRDETGYLEFNFSPSTRWAAYRFDAYRAGMAPLEIAPPRIEVTRTAASFELNAVIELAEAWETRWRIGIAAIIEEEGRAMSYWALAHPPGRPDFHHADCFAGELPVAEPR